MKVLLLSLLCLYQSFVMAKMPVPKLDYTQAWQQYLEQSSHQSPKQQFPYQSCFEKAAKQHNLPVSLLLAMARGESDFNPNAHSSANAYGLMQIVWPNTAKDLGIHSIAELKKPCVNIEAGARYIKKQIKRFDGSVHLALAAYNYGPTAIARRVDNIPQGANWYSGYIYQHLQYVLGENAAVGGFSAPVNYRDEQKIRLTSFNQAYRATAFIAAIQHRAATVRLDTFDYGMGRYHVVMLYGSQQELKQSKSALNKAGFYFN